MWKCTAPTGALKEIYWRDSDRGSLFSCFPLEDVPWEGLRVVLLRLGGASQVPVIHYAHPHGGSKSGCCCPSWLHLYNEMMLKMFFIQTGMWFQYFLRIWNGKAQNLIGNTHTHPSGHYFGLVGCGMEEILQKTPGKEVWVWITSCKQCCSSCMSISSLLRSKRTYTTCICMSEPALFIFNLWPWCLRVPK